MSMTWHKWLEDMLVAGEDDGYCLWSTNDNGEIRVPDIGIDNITSFASYIASSICESEEFCDVIDKVKWINPAAVIVPYHPTDILNYDDRCEWAEVVSFAHYLPLAVSDSVEQKALIEAYFEANFSKGITDKQHMSYSIMESLRIDHGHVGCYVFKVTDCFITVTGCDHINDSCGTGNVFSGAHYRNLFEISAGNAIIFKPHSVLSRANFNVNNNVRAGDNTIIVEEKGLLRDYMVGTYFCLDADDTDCVCNLDNKLIELSDRLSGVMYLRARRAAYTALRKNIALEVSRVEKYKKMFDLLSSPLDGLVKTLEESQSNVQSLRSILYDPHKSLFSISSITEEYFHENRTCNFGSVSWKGLHTPETFPDNSDKAKRDSEHARAATIGVIICKLFGLQEHTHTNEQSLYEDVKSLLTVSSENREHEDLRRVIRIILGIEITDSEFFIHFRKCLSKGSVEGQVNPMLSNQLTKLKKIIFTPFKPHANENPLEPLALIVYQYVPDMKIKIIEEYLGIEDTNYYDVNIVLSGFCKKIIFRPELPVPRYIDMLKLIDGVINFASLNRNQLSDMTITNLKTRCQIELCFEKDLFHLKKLNLVLADMKYAFMAKASNVSGNFSKPFVEFAAALGTVSRVCPTVCKGDADASVIFESQYENTMGNEEQAHMKCKLKFKSRQLFIELKNEM